MSLINLNTSINFKNYFKSEKLKAIKNNTYLILGCVSVLALLVPSSYYLFCSITSFWTFLKDAISVGLGLISLLTVFILGLAIFEGLPEDFGNNKNYTNPSEYFYDKEGVFSKSINYYDDWLSLLLSFHLFDENKIQFSEIKEIEASMKFNEEILSKIEVKDLPTDIKEEVVQEQKKIYEKIKVFFIQMVANNLMKNPKFTQYLNLTIEQKLDQIKTKQEEHLIKNEYANQLRVLAIQKKEEVLKQKEEVVIVEKEVKEAKEKLKSLAL